MTRSTGLTHSDSIDNFVGFITGSQNTVGIDVPPQNEHIFQTENLSYCRLFPEWDSIKEESVTNVKYQVSTRTPRGDTLNLNASDSLIFAIRTTSDFKFSEFMGTVMKTYYKAGDTNKVPG